MLMDVSADLLREASGSRSASGPSGIVDLLASRRQAFSLAREGVAPRGYNKRAQRGRPGTVDCESLLNGDIHCACAILFHEE